MASRGRLARVSGALFTLAMVAFFTALPVVIPANAVERPVTLGQVQSTVKPSDTDLPGYLRTRLEEELLTLDLHKVPRGKRAVLTADLVQMDSEAKPRTLATTAVVRLTLVEPSRGRILAVLEGRARAENDPVHARAVERHALAGAAHSAMQRVPEALK